MASGLSRVALLAISVVMFPPVSAGSRDCKAYTDLAGIYHYSEKCLIYCCGTCFSRYCCQDSFWRLTEDAQEDCDQTMIQHSPLPMILGILSFVVILLIIICCCVCPCCCLYKMCRKPRPVIATTTHTTVITNTPQSYPQQPTMPAPPQSYQGNQYPPYQPVPVQPGFGAHPAPTTPYPAQPFVPGPPPTYQEATGPAYGPTPMPYNQAAFMPGQPGNLIHPPPAPLQPNAPPANMDFLSQPAFNPDFVSPPPKTG